MPSRNNKFRKILFQRVKDLIEIAELNDNMIVLEYVASMLKAASIT